MRPTRARAAAAFLAALLPSAALAVPPPAPQAPVVGVTAQQATYLGQVATRSRFPAVPGTLIGTGANAATEIQGRSALVFQPATTGPKIAVPFFYMVAGTGEVAIPGTTTWSGWLQVGTTRYPLSWGGQPSVSATNSLSVAFSDPVRDLSGNLLNIPAGTIATLWLNEKNPTAVYFTYDSGLHYPADAIALGSVNAPLAPMTNTTPLTGYTLSSGGLFAAAVIGQTNQPAGCLIDDSRGVGIWDSPSDALALRGELERRIGAQYAFINMGASGDTIGTSGSMAVRQQLFRYCSFMVNELGINNTPNTSATQIALARTAMAAAFRQAVPNGLVYGTTLVGRTSTTDSGATLSGQTPWSATNETNRTQFNALDRAGIAGENDFIDLSDAMDPARTGNLPVNGSAFYFMANDGSAGLLHETQAGAIMEAQSPVWNHFNPALR